MELSQIAGIIVHGCRKRVNMATHFGSMSPSNIINLLLLTSGKLHFEFKGEKVVAGKNDLVAWKNTDLISSYPAATTPVSYYVVGMDILSQKNRVMTLEELSIPHVLKITGSKAVEDLFSRMDTMYSSRDPLRLFKCSQLAFSLLEYISVSTDENRGTGRLSAKQIDYRILKAIQYITSRYKKSITITELAKLTCMTPDYFTKVFKKNTGISPVQYILELKIHKAKDFLMRHAEPLTFTGHELGFHDYSHFYKTFKHFTGLTPGEFIKKSKIGYKPKQESWNI